MPSLNRPSVSVIVPAYNAERFIAEALDSALHQNYAPMEIIVIDDGSTDSTGRLVSSFGAPVSYIYQRNSGGFAGIPRNVGMARASGEYILFLDADDVMLPDRVNVQADFLRSHPQVGCVFGDYQNFIEGSATDELSHFQTCQRLWAMLSKKTHVVLPPKDATALLLRENIGIPSSLAIRRSVLEQVPGFPNHLRIGEDFEFVYRIARRFPVGAVNRLVVRRRLHGANLTGDSLRTLHDQVASFADLRRSESDIGNIRQLGDRMHRCHIGLARAYGNQRQYRCAIGYGVRAFRGAFPRRLGRIFAGIRTILRTLAIAARLKRPAP